MAAWQGVQFVSSFYTSLKSVASRLLQSRGQQVTFSRDVVSGFDPVLGVETKTTSTFTVYGASFDYTNNEVDGERVQTGDIRFIMEAGTLPKIGDTTTIDSKSYRVMSVKETNPAGTAVIYEVQLRQ